MAHHYYLNKDIHGRVKVAEDEEGNRYALEIIGDDPEMVANKVAVLDTLGYLHNAASNLKSNSRNERQPLLEPKARHYVLSQLFEGITLEEYLALYVNELSWQEKYCLAYKMSCAIAFLHDRNIVHGALTARNFLLQFTGDSLNIVVVGLNHAQPIGYAEGLVSFQSKKDDILAFGNILKNNFQLKETNEEGFNLRVNLCEEDPDWRPAIEAVSLRFVGFQNCVPTSARLSKQLFHSYENNCLMPWRRMCNEVLATKLANDNNDRYFVQDINSKTLHILEGVAPLQPGEIMKMDGNENGLKILTPLEYVTIKNEQTPLVDIIKESKQSLAQCKKLALNEIQGLVRRTNHIDELAEFFKQLKFSETTEPFLRKERHFWRLGNAGMTDSWKDAILIFKVRAMELAKNEMNLQKSLSNPEKYIPILEEKRARLFTFKSTQLCEFEKAFSPR
jgi:hypothetical protein